MSRKRGRAAVEDSPAEPEPKHQAKARNSDAPENLQASLKAVMLSSWASHASPLAWAVASERAAEGKRAEASELLCGMLFDQLSVSPSGSPLLLNYVCYAYTAGMLPAIPLVAKVESADLAPRLSCQILACTARVASCERSTLDLTARCQLLVAAAKALNKLCGSRAKPILQQWGSSGALVPLLLAAPHEISEEWRALQEISKQTPSPLTSLVSPVKLEWLPEHCVSKESDWPTAALRVYLGCCLVSGGACLSDVRTADTVAMFAHLMGDKLAAGSGA